MRGLIVSIILSVVSPSILVSADCYRDNDWSIAMIEKQTYWTAIPHDGKWYNIEHAQCLAMETKTCVPCSSIKPTEISFADTMSPCWASFAQPGKLKLLNMTRDGSLGSVVLGAQERDISMGMLACDINPPRQVLAFKCGN